MQNHQQPRHDNRNDGNNNRHDRPFRRDRDQQQGRNRDRYNNDRQDRGDRNGMADRDRPVEGRPPPLPAPSQERPPEQAAEGDPRRRDRLPPAHEQPEFLRRPVRRARTENGDPGKDDPSRE